MKVQAPVSDGYEQRLLGAVLSYPQALSLCADLIDKESFRTQAHQAVYEAACELWSQGKPVEPVTVADRLSQKEQIADVGGYGTLGDLFETACPACSIAEYAKKVRDHSLLRRLERAGAEIQRLAREPNGPPESVLEQAEKDIFSVTRGLGNETASPISRAIGKAYDRLDARACQGEGTLYGWTDLDLLTAGLHGSELVVVAARPGVGKTAWAVNLLDSVASQGRACLFASLEMAEAEVAERLLCRRAEIDGHFLRQGALSPGDRSRLTKAGAAISALPLVIDDAPSQSALRICGAARRMASGEQGLGLVVIDYIQLVEPENRKDPRYEQVGKTSRRFKQLAKELDVPVVALAQLNRGADERKDQRPRMRDLRESGNLEQDADCVVLLHPNGKFLDLIVEKQRNGPTGEVSLYYDRGRHRITDADASPFTGE